MIDDLHNALARISADLQLAYPDALHALRTVQRVLPASLATVNPDRGLGIFEGAILAEFECSPESSREIVCSVLAVLDQVWRARKAQAAGLAQKP